MCPKWINAHFPVRIGNGLIKQSLSFNSGTQCWVKCGLGKQPSMIYSDQREFCNFSSGEVLVCDGSWALHQSWTADECINTCQDINRGKDVITWSCFEVWSILQMMMCCVRITMAMTSAINVTELLFLPGLILRRFKGAPKLSTYVLHSMSCCYTLYASIHMPILQSWLL